MALTDLPQGMGQAGRHSQTIDYAMVTADEEVSILTNLHEFPRIRQANRGYDTGRIKPF
jgi:hypothetical protein